MTDLEHAKAKLTELALEFRDLGERCSLAAVAGDRVEYARTMTRGKEVLNLMNAYLDQIEHLTGEPAR